jgi:hypothetical protein
VTIVSMNVGALLTCRVNPSEMPMVVSCIAKSCTCICTGQQASLAEYEIPYRRLNSNSLYKDTDIRVCSPL